jgi:hypothetical protein
LPIFSGGLAWRGLRHADGVRPGHRLFQTLLELSLVGVPRGLVCLLIRHVRISAASFHGWVDHRRLKNVSQFNGAKGRKFLPERAGIGLVRFAASF